MARVPLAQYDEAQPEVRAVWDAQVRAHGRMTNMKRTLAHSRPALDALLNWYPLHDAVAAFLGERATIVFTHAISTQSDCLICSTFFRRILIEDGQDPDALTLSLREQTLVEFGRQLARNANQVDDALYAHLAEFLTAEQLVALTAFGAIMLATNVFNNALRVDLDEYLLAYRRGQEQLGQLGHQGQLEHQEGATEEADEGSVSS
jgi:alkylhydroperoxidase family enzyme